MSNWNNTTKGTTDPFNNCWYLFPLSILKNVNLINFVFGFADSNIKMVGEKEQYLAAGTAMNLSCVVGKLNDINRKLIWTHDNQVTKITTKILLNERTFL